TSYPRPTEFTKKGSEFPPTERAHYDYRFGKRSRHVDNRGQGLAGTSHHATWTPHEGHILPPLEDSAAPGSGWSVPHHYQGSDGSDKPALSSLPGPARSGHP